MKNILTYLVQLGFSEIEAKMYIKLLNSGSLTVAQLAESVKINRTAAYGYINTLLEKGIIAKVKGSANKVSANPPEQLHILVEQKAAQIGMLQEKLPGVIATLSASLPQIPSNPQGEIRYFKGRNAVKNIYNEALKSNEIKAYYNPADILEIFPNNEALFTKAIQSNPKMAVYEICEDSPTAREDILAATRQQIRHYWKILPSDVKLTSNDILLFDGKVAIINLTDKDTINGVILHNADYYNNSVQLFDLLWRFLPDWDFS